MFNTKTIYLKYIKPYLIFTTMLSKNEKHKILLELLINITKDTGVDLNEFLTYIRSYTNDMGFEEKKV